MPRGASRTGRDQARPDDEWPDCPECTGKAAPRNWQNIGKWWQCLTCAHVFAATALLARTRPPRTSNNQEHPMSRSDTSTSRLAAVTAAIGRILRGLVLFGVLAMVVWVGGTLMEASHVDTHTHERVGLVAAAAFVVVGVVVSAIRSRRG